MTTADTPPPAGIGRRKRFDARRNQQTLLDAAPHAHDQFIPRLGLGGRAPRNGKRCARA